MLKKLDLKRMFLFAFVYAAVGGVIATQVDISAPAFIELDWLKIAVIPLIAG